MIILWILLGIVGLVLILLLAAVIRTLLIPGRTSTYQPDRIRSGRWTVRRIHCMA